MNNILVAFLICLLGVGGLLGVMTINYANTEAELAIAIEAKQKDNQNEYDLMWKKISQVAQVTEEQKNALKEIFVDYAAARTSGNSNSNDGALMKWIQEAVPNVDTSTFNNLQNIIVNSRNRFALQQKELIDLEREHNLMFRRFPSNVFMTVLGREEIKVTIVTSTRTEEAFTTGKDDNINVFGK